MSIESDYIRNRGMKILDDNVMYINDVGHIEARAYDECVLLGKIYNKVILADKTLETVQHLTAKE